MAPFSKRTDWESAPNALSEMAAEKRRRGEPVLNLVESNPTRCAFRYLEEKLLGPLADPAGLVYEPDPRGLNAAREAVSRYYRERGVEAHPADIFLTASTSEAYSFLFRLLADPGECAAVPKPSYPLFDYLAGLNDTELIGYRLVYRSEWGIDEDSLCDAMRRRPRMVFAVNPNNPTGNFVRPAEKELLTRLCLETGAALVSDEVFHDFSWEKGSAFPGSFCGNSEVPAFTLSGISKILGLPQMKLAWIVLGGPAEFRRRAAERLETITDTYLSVGTPVQRALPAWLGASERILYEIRERIGRNRACLETAFAGARASVLRQSGGWYSVIGLRPGPSGEETALGLLEKESVLVHPGYLYDFDADRYLVLSLIAEERLFQEGVSRLCRYLRT